MRADVPPPRSMAEAIDQLAHASAVPLPVQAERIGRDYGYLRKACSQFDDAHPYRADLIVAQTLASGDAPDTRNYVVLDYLARMVGGVFVAPVAGGGDVGELARVMKEFAEFAAAVADGSADQKYSDDEARRIAAEWHDVAAAGARLVMHVEQMVKAQQGAPAAPAARESARRSRR